MYSKLINQATGNAAGDRGPHPVNQKIDISPGMVKVKILIKEKRRKTTFRTLFLRSVSAPRVMNKDKLLPLERKRTFKGKGYLQMKGLPTLSYLPKATVHRLHSLELVGRSKREVSL